jgi:hypothetical protein
MKPSEYNSLIKQAGLGRALSRLVSKGINKVIDLTPAAKRSNKAWNAYVKHMEKLENRFPKETIRNADGTTTTRLTPEGEKAFRRAYLDEIDRSNIRNGIWTIDFSPERTKDMIRKAIDFKDPVATTNLVRYIKAIKPPRVPYKKEVIGYDANYKPIFK